MKSLIAVMAVCLALIGCATSHFTAGRDFPSTSVANITKGKTTTTELKSLFGEPYAKSAVSETDEKWVYTYTNGSTHAQNYVVTMKVTTTGTQKTLDVLIRNDVVINYTFSEGPAPGTTTATN
ncbi:outer membrane protein assembly factor BamE (lipoprotein component of BamABCDE complex) [Pseudomonas sp. TE12234]